MASNPSIILEENGKEAENARLLSPKIKGFFYCYEKCMNGSVFSDRVHALPVY